MIKLINANCLDALNNIQKEYSNIIYVSDPPFNIGYKYNNYKDNMKEDDYYTFLSKIFCNNKTVLIHYPENLYKFSYRTGMLPERVISWIYNSNTGKQHRDIAFFGVKPNMAQVRQPYKNPNDKRIKERIARGCKGAKLYDWWNINQVKNVSKEKLDHPCQMPIEVMKNIIGILPYECTIVDPFMGTGTTGQAVTEMNKEQNANRKFIGIEMDKKYFEIAKERIEEQEKK